MPPPPPRARDTPSSSTTPSAAALAAARDAAFEPVGWREHFDHALDIPVGDVDVFRVYTARDEGAHDAASASSSGSASASASASSGAASSAPASSSASSSAANPVDAIVLCVHGCPYTALSWAPAARALARRLGPSRVVAAVDLRGHGETRCADETALDADTLAADLVAVAAALRRRFESEAIRTDTNGEDATGNAKGREGTRPKVFLVGHSAGGAAAARAASSSSSSSAAAPFAGVVVVDATEGAGLAAIPRMEANLAAGVRPESFASERDAIAWALRSGLTRNVDAARVSVPSQLVRRDDEKNLMSDDPFVSDDHFVSGETKPSESESESRSRSRTPSSSRFVWRTSLAATRPHWRGWFDGLSRAFLAAPCPKLLALVGVDRLDDELVAAQMSGKFQMVLFPDAGHAVHEDEPERVADAVAAFVRRYAEAKHVGNGVYAYGTKNKRRGAAVDGAATRELLGDVRETDDSFA